MLEFKTSLVTNTGSRSLVLAPPSLSDSDPFGLKVASCLGLMASLSMCRTRAFGNLRLPFRSPLPLMRWSLPPDSLPECSRMTSLSLLQQTGLSVAALPLAPAAERRYVGQTARKESMTDLRIEVGSLSDLEPLLDLLENAAIWLWDRGIHQWAPGSMRAQKSILAEWARSGHLIAARSGSELVGACALVPHPTDEWAERAGPSLYVHKLVVARSHAGQGIAHRILAQCEARARAEGVLRVRLDCWDGNAKLRSFYRACAYRELEVVPSHGYLVRLFEPELT